jgi:hypothetical protein
MKKTFLKSITTGIVGLTLVSGCSMFHKEAAHSCNSNSCKGKKESTTNDTTSTKKETSGCHAKKDATHKCSAKKASAKNNSKTDTKADTKTDAKK